MTGIKKICVIILKKKGILLNWIMGFIEVCKELMQFPIEIQFYLKY
jgi:hypothetical protein